MQVRTPSQSIPWDADRFIEEVGHDRSARETRPSLCFLWANLVRSRKHKASTQDPRRRTSRLSKPALTIFARNWYSIRWPRWTATNCFLLIAAHSERHGGRSRRSRTVLLSGGNKGESGKLGHGRRTGSGQHYGGREKGHGPAGTLLIEACKTVGIEVPSFCYYPNLSLQGACRMCLVKIEKAPKLQTACTTVIGEGMIVTTDSDEIRQARKGMVELLLGNHPLDCPVCDAGGECELQDMTFSYGAAESKYIDAKNHKDEQQWSPVVFFDRPRCILCYRCVRVCNEGMDVAALGIQNRGVSSIIAPNEGDHLDCEECGMCIDICPVGALTSGAYRYKTRPWEMNHVGTTCTHCADGCKTTLGIRRSDTGMEIVRGDNRDKSGINGDFLCIKGRYAFDFANHEDRLKQPLIRKNGRLTPSTWEEAFELIGREFKTVRERDGGKAIGVIGSNRTTNEENYLLQKFARVVLQTNNIDHHRTADFPALAAALAGKADATASMREVASAPAILLIGNDPTEQHPLLAWQIRNNVRLHGARLYVVNAREIKLKRQAAAFLQIPEGTESKFAEFLAGRSAVQEFRGSRLTPAHYATSCVPNRTWS